MRSVVACIAVALCLASVALAQNRIDYALEFNGEWNNQTGTITSKALSTTIKTLIDATDGFTSTTSTLIGVAAITTASITEYKTNGDGTATYRQTGNITFFSNDHMLFFDGYGTAEPLNTDGLFNGAAVLRILNGAGAFSGASGFLTNNLVAQVDPDQKQILSYTNLQVAQVWIPGNLTMTQ
ncbi:hypothetical protein CAOG_07873 [Capsaspora owczarzaki ATCC 30864]|uniref:Uncharacterized protein n=1 Tax=Capsaspora owczarzaki (strain ATCC 30864) TaxID=595528 RepID=A0A0D2WXA3_CAPO3|nr:hypothetical protein CAOG_07873 [Capsaspora owczarzaki ATCC 30864]KJE97770.1 hypothetical protein CAOG_007873 [Capsaspora owczarzaki ATCC 30864]|eukprot:XP_004342958.1 hypothetical protein CAOG_07873 [Capsaspora owczarzaki ATCC 30864]